MRKKNCRQHITNPRGGRLGTQTPVLFNKDLRCAKHCGEDSPVLKNIFFYKLIKQVRVLNSFLIHQENRRASHKRSKPQIQCMLFSFCQSEPARGVNKHSIPLAWIPVPSLFRNFLAGQMAWRGRALFSNGSVKGDRAIKFGSP